jgi:hypothetical protein
MQRETSSLQRTLHSVFVEERLFTCAVLSTAIGIAWLVRLPFPSDNVFLVHVEAARPAIYGFLLWSYRGLAFGTPFVLLSALASFLFVHWFQPRSKEDAGQLPPYPSIYERRQLTAILGEVHHQTIIKPATNPQWLTIPEQGLYTGIAIFGSIGSGKTQAAILPLMRQLFGYKASSTTEKLSGLVLEVKGDLCRRLRGILRQYGREDDYVEIGFHSDWRYNPLHNDLDAYALAYNIASLLTNIWGRGKEPFWQQSYTDLVKYIIILHKVKNDYVTLFDVYATAISPALFEQLLIETGAKFRSSAWVSISRDGYRRCEVQVSRYGFQFDREMGVFLAKLTPELERFIVAETDVEATVYEPTPGDEQKRQLFEAVDRWYWEHWKHLRPDIKTSVVQGIAVFLSLFDTDPMVKRIFCPPKELYEGKQCVNDPDGVVMPPFSQLIEEGKVCGLNFPVALNPGVAKAVGTMMKQDFQRAMLLRIPKMEEYPERYFRPAVFMCDEYQTYATVGASDPNGDERFLSLSRQPKCIPIIATQSVNSIKEALPGSGYKTLLQAFRTKVFLTTSDPETARYASELCGKVDKTRINYSISESSNDAHVGLLSGKASSNRASVSASKTYQRQKEALFDDKVFYQLKNAQAVAVAYDGINPLPPTYLFLKPDFMPTEQTWFEQNESGFDPQRAPGVAA